MTRLPTLTPRKIVAALKRAGFNEHHSHEQHGSHLYLWNPQTRRMTSVPMHAKDLPRGTTFTIIKQAGLTIEEFQALL
ncbi:MAG: type II toxin-antitoxin system HicA family toxin [bacterium]